MDTIAKDGVSVTIKAGSRKSRPVGPAATANAVLDITVLMGGPSSEREVSLITGAAIADALERNGHRVTRSDISPDDLSALDRPGMDLVFIALHGDFGESGEVQRLCEQRGLRYIGSPPRASELAIDKAAAKEVFAAAGLKVAPGAVIDKDQSPQDVAAVLASFPLPVVLKPIDGGSSVDVIIARTAEDREAGVMTLLAKYGRFLLEQFIHGRELTVGILGEQALPIIEILPDGQFYDYRAKYSDQAQTRYVFDHDIPEAKVREIQQAAVAAFKSLHCRDISRVDFILDEQGTPWVLEINTIPGFTSHSLVPKAAARIGLSFDQLVQRIANMAMAR